MGNNIKKINMNKMITDQIRRFDDLHYLLILNSRVNNKRYFYTLSSKHCKYVELLHDIIISRGNRKTYPDILYIFVKNNYIIGHKFKI